MNDFVKYFYYNLFFFINMYFVLFMALIVLYDLTIFLLNLGFKHYILKIIIRKNNLNNLENPLILF